MARVEGQGSYGVTVIFILPLESINKEKKRREIKQEKGRPSGSGRATELQSITGRWREITQRESQCPCFSSNLVRDLLSKKKEHFLIISKNGVPSPSFCDSLKLPPTPFCQRTGETHTPPPLPALAFSNKHPSPPAESGTQCFVQSPSAPHWVKPSGGIPKIDPEPGARGAGSLSGSL